MIQFKQLCCRCKRNYVVSTWRDKYPVCFDCQKGELSREIVDPEMKAFFDIPAELYKQNAFLRNIKIGYLRYGRLTDPQKDAFRKAVDRMTGATSKIEKTPEEWKALLTPEQYKVLREKGTEPAFSGNLHDNHADGTYACAGCGAKLFSSEEKFESGTGWPSFSTALPEAVAMRPDASHGMQRTEVVCRACGGHLGHLFADGPAPSGQRYCINSTALAFKAKRGRGRR